jgi:uncharacterized RmlC-like cupin family protein
MGTIYRVRPDERVEGQPTPGMAREQAIGTDRLWSGFVTTEPGSESAWHHHSGYESSIFMLTGELRMEFGPGGSESFVARPGDFIYVGKEIVHREGNPSDAPATFVVTRGGQGEVVVNVEGPE